MTSGSSSAMEQYSSSNLEHGSSQNLPPGVLHPSEPMEQPNTGDDNEGEHSGQDNIDHHVQ